MAANGLQENGVCAFVLHEAKNDPQIVPRAVRPVPFESPVEFVCPQLRVESVGDEDFERLLESLGSGGILLNCTPRGAHKGGRS
jgi:hypothetical protein